MNREGRKALLYHMKKNLFVVIPGAVMVVFSPPAIAQFVKDDEVQLTRDEPLPFNSSTYRQGQRGDIYSARISERQS